MTDIIMCIKHSNISKETLRNKIEEIKVRASHAVNDTDGCFYGKGETVEKITFYWFKNWLHPALKSRTARPNPYMYNMSDDDERKEYLDLLFKRLYENGQQNFDYTMETILNYIESED